MASIGHFAKILALSAALAATGAGAAAAGTLDTVRQDKTIRLAVRADAPPFSYRDVGGEPAGFMVDLCRAVATGLAAQLNLDQLKVVFVPVTAEDRFDAIETGKADLLCEPTSATLSRREKVDFSIPTFVDGASLLVKGEGPSDLAALAGKKVGVLGGTTTEKGLRDTLATLKINAEVVPAATHEDGIKQLEDGAVAAYFADRAILAWLASKASDPSKLRLANDYLSIEPYALALPRGDSDFRLAVDRALSHIYNGGGIALVFAKTFGPQMQPSETIKTLYLVSALPD
ncbi:amino acid ABC transporter substrate-binding protein (PAAT family) [Roseiarcus fermentans]|uniref:Amino acid ABC transporter substrate-binding protein (PAAT family) n=1 Tax=Roseiarcus fermentans TaxID=1473586 RepID=A0A366EM55_9HYPH|nr:amino acid ABC transporter substrate-binding protein [Roseiarcus fermentans]RBP02569.1 amino acid ABC transporter substrate-binding protein (PAAT family) [Roseiarcus fermentans]